VTERDRARWDDRHEQEGKTHDATPALPSVFAAHEHHFPTEGAALDLACGRGQVAVWLAQRGLHVWGLDVSPVAVRFAQELAARHGVDSRCRFEAVDLDGGLPPGPAADVIMCNLFRDPRLDQAIVERLALRGLLGIAVLSEVDHGPGPFRAVPGGLNAAFASLTVIADGEGHGQAWLMATATVSRARASQGSASGGEVELRRARQDESVEIADVWLRSRAASAPAIPPPIHTDDEVQGWFREVVLPNREVWVAEAGGSVIALLVLDDDWVDQLYVAPDWTSQGVGTRLLGLAQQRRPTGLQLWTFQANTGARRFYERHGFAAAAMTDGDNEEGAPDVRYEWPGDAAGTTSPHRR